MRLLVVSNRLPAKVVKEGGIYRYEPSSGGLASGLGTYVESERKSGKSFSECLWVGWPGSPVEEKGKERVSAEMLEKYNAHCVFLSARETDTFYKGFCNKTIWPLFHYFPVYTSYSKENWEQYVAVNKIFALRVLEVARPGDTIWIHDYHLLLLPAMIREKMPDTPIGFFLHIPFPAFDVFRLLPRTWRKQILEGLYGADLIGFHTADYRNYFIHSALRISGVTRHAGDLLCNGRVVKAGAFPMGIDFNKYNKATRMPEVTEIKKRIRKNTHASRLVLSLDRQDYSKGILNRLYGYEYFLKTYPQWKGKVSLLLIVVPSRIGVDQYQSIKSKIDEQVGSINGRYGSLKWTPVIYQYRSLSFSELIALYNLCDVALITPLRDGMNLVAKEYLAARTNNKGVLILSEMTGAADELSESIIINPNNIEEIGDSLAMALSTHRHEQAKSLKAMQKRISAYDIYHWADEFLTSLKKAREQNLLRAGKSLSDPDLRKISAAFKAAASRILFLDYDGTLVSFAGTPEKAKPGKPLLALLTRLANEKNTEVVLISGRNRKVLDRWFSGVPVHLSAEHGLFTKETGKKWKTLKRVRNQWMKKVIPLLKQYAEKVPGSLIEEKENALVFHYRQADTDSASHYIHELMRQLVISTGTMDVHVVPGNKIVEIRARGINKGVAASTWLSKKIAGPRFILAAGDDTTDEDLFAAMPANAVTIMVGSDPTHARHSVESPEDLVRMLKMLVE